MPTRQRIALVSQGFLPADKSANLRAVEAVLQGEAGRDCDLVVFPELCISGGLWKDGAQVYPSLAEAVPEGPSCRAVAQLAQRFHTTLCAGLIEEAGGCHFITHFLCGPQGYIGKQRKLFPHNPTKPSVFASGARLAPLPLFGQPCAILACADFILPEPTHLAGLAGCALLLCPTDCFPASERNQRMIAGTLQARALDTGAHAVAAFGSTPGDAPELDVLAAIAYDPQGCELANAVRASSASRVTVIEATLQAPRQIWGGFKVRGEAVLRPYWSQA